MAIDTPARASSGPRPWLLVLLGLAIAAYVVATMFSGPAVPAGASTTAPGAANAAQPEKIDPAELDVKIETLTAPPADPAEGDRNPFRFQPKPTPPPPPMASQGEGRPSYVPPPVQPGPTGPKPIAELIKFIGIVDTGSAKIGAFSDCRYTFSGREGEIIEGRFRVVRIGVESAVLEYVDGQGRTTLPLNGQACVGK